MRFILLLLLLASELLGQETKISDAELNLRKFSVEPKEGFREAVSLSSGRKYHVSKDIDLKLSVASVEFNADRRLAIFSLTPEAQKAMQSFSKKREGERFGLLLGEQLLLVAEFTSSDIGDFQIQFSQGNDFEIFQKFVREKEAK